jgi:hypothetical protein
MRRTDGYFLLTAVLTSILTAAGPVVAQDTRPLESVLRASASDTSPMFDLPALNQTALDQMLRGADTRERQAALYALADTMYRVQVGRITTQSDALIHFDRVIAQARAYDSDRLRSSAVGAMKSGVTLLSAASARRPEPGQLATVLDFGRSAFRLHQSLFTPSFGLAANANERLPPGIERPAYLRLMVALHPDISAAVLHQWLGNATTQFNALDYSVLVQSQPASVRGLLEATRGTTTGGKPEQVVSERLNQMVGQLTSLDDTLLELQRSADILKQAKTDADIQQARKEFAGNVFKIIDGLEAASSLFGGADPAAFHAIRGMSNLAVAASDSDYIGVAVGVVQLVALSMQHPEPSPSQTLAAQLAQVQRDVIRALSVINSQLQSLQLDVRDLSRMVVKLESTILEASGMLARQMDTQSKATLTSLTGIDNILRADHARSLSQDWERLDARVRALASAIRSGRTDQLPEAEAAVREAAASVRVNLRSDSSGLAHPAFVTAQPCLAGLAARIKDQTPLSAVARAVAKQIESGVGDEYARCYVEVMEYFPRLPTGTGTAKSAQANIAWPGPINASLLSFHLNRLRSVLALLPASKMRAELMADLGGTLAPTTSHAAFLTTPRGYDMVLAAYEAALRHGIDKLAQLTEGDFSKQIRRYDTERRRLFAHWSSSEEFSKPGPYYNAERRMVIGVEDLPVPPSIASRWPSAELSQALESVLAEENRLLTEEFQRIRNNDCRDKRQKDPQMPPERCVIDYAVAFDAHLAKVLTLFNETQVAQINGAFDRHLSESKIAASVKGLAELALRDFAAAAFLEGLLGATAELVAPSQSVGPSERPTAAGVLDQILLWLSSLASGETTIGDTFLTRWDKEWQKAETGELGLGTSAAFLTYLRANNLPVAKYESVRGPVTYTFVTQNAEDPRLKLPMVSYEAGASTFRVTIHWQAPAFQWFKEYKCWDCGVEARRGQGNHGAVEVVGWSVKERPSSKRALASYVVIAEEGESGTGGLDGGTGSKLAAVVVQSAEGAVGERKAVPFPSWWRGVSGVAELKGITGGGRSLLLLSRDLFVLAEQENRSDLVIGSIESLLARKDGMRNLLREEMARRRAK